MIDFIDNQLAAWPLARRNYTDLGKTERRLVNLGDFRVAVQYNPARIISTGAKIDNQSIKQRPCFLCRENRPEEQLGVDMMPDWELLLNPYPIFPSHFTIAGKTHRPQEGLPLDMIEMAEKLPGHVIFFNGAHAGASCPDHLHCQAVKTAELPLMQLVEKCHIPASSADDWHIASSCSLNLDMPFFFKSFIITPDLKGMQILSDLENLIGRQYIEEGLINLFVWIDNAGFLRVVSIPRKAHRPSCYGSQPGQFLVSPGSIDMAGIIITPRIDDFHGITAADLSEIYADCALPNRTFLTP